MKKSIILLLLLAGVGTAVAQHKSAFGILGGSSYYNQINEFENGDGFNDAYTLGFIAGIYWESVPSNHFVIDGGLYYVQKGFYNNNYAISGDFFSGYYAAPIEKGETYEKLNYLEFATHAGLKLGWLRLYVGPYFALGINGTQVDDYTLIEDGYEYVYDNEWEVKFEDVSYESWEENCTYLHPFDAGIDVGASIQIGRGLILRANYQLGMVNVRPEIDNYEYYNRDSYTIYNSGGRVSLIILLSQRE